MKTKILYYFAFVYMFLVGLGSFYILRVPAEADAVCTQLALTVCTGAGCTPPCAGGNLNNVAQTGNTPGGVPVRTGICQTPP